MNAISQQDVTLLLEDCIKGKKDSVNELIPHVYFELKRISSKYLGSEYRNSTLQTTELVHEAYIKMVGSNNVTLLNKAHFFGIAAHAMRQILVDHARRRKAIKRGEGKSAVELNHVLQLSEHTDEQMLELDDALKKLEMLEERSSKLVELRFFSGLTIDESAEVLNISPATAKRDWTFARAWLHREMESA